MATFITLVLGGYGNFGARICRALAGGAAPQHGMQPAAVSTQAHGHLSTVVTAILWPVGRI